MGPAPDIRELARQGITVVVATRDEHLRPSVARAWGPLLSQDGAQLTLCVEAPDNSATEANLVAGSPLAATLTRPSTYTSVQLKGALSQVRPPLAAELERVAAHVDSFAIETAPLGLDPELARRLAGDRLVTIVVEIAERYDQTPGSGAGARL